MAAMKDTHFAEAEHAKSKGNEFFKAGKFGRALDAYAEAIDLSENGDGDGKMQTSNPSIPVYYANRAFCHLKMEDYQSAVVDSTQAIERNPEFPKGWYRRGCANMGLGRHDKALEDFTQLCKLAPRDQDAREKQQQCRMICDQEQLAKPINVQDVLDKIDTDCNFTRLGNDFSILAGIPLSQKASLVRKSMDDIVLNRFMGSMCGMVVADALGAPLEFLPVQDDVGAPIPSYFELSTMRWHEPENRFLLKPGQWTDDASMGLCMADSLILKKAFDGSDMRVRFWYWWNRGYNNAFRKSPIKRHSVGLGGNIGKSLGAMDAQIKSGRTDQISPAYEADTQDSGNGSVMRLTPMALFYHSADFQELTDAARRSSYTTHPGDIAAEACAFLSYLIASAVNSTVPLTGRSFLDDATAKYLQTSCIAEKSGDACRLLNQLVTSSPERREERCWNWKNATLDIADTMDARGSQYNGYPNTRGYFGSYCLDGMAMALWSVYHTTSFDDAVVRSVNLLGDADSHGSITGQLAGAIYGYSSINPQFVEWLTQWDDHDFAVRALLLRHVGASQKLAA